MTITQNKNDGILTLSISGRMDTVTAPQFTEALDAALPDVQSLVLDFQELEYISSAGLRVLLQAQKTMSKRGGMIIRHVNDAVAEVFAVTGFTDILTIE